MKMTIPTAAALLALAAPLAALAADAPPPPPLPPKPVVVIEAVRGPALLSRFDTLSAGETVVLGEDGALMVSYLDSCRHETVFGGTVIVGPEALMVEGGRVTVESPPCPKPTDPVTTVRTPRPRFDWSAGVAQLSVWRITGLRAAQVWEGRGSGAADYPSEAPVLQPGVLYAAMAVLRDGARRQGLFHVDGGIPARPDDVGTVRLR